MTARKRGNWSSQELERLKVLYPKCPEERCAALLKRSVGSVRRRAKEVFSRPPQRGDWTAEDDYQLRMSYGVLTPSALSLVLARPERDVRARARELRQEHRRGPWTPREISMLKQLYGSRADEDLEVCLSRSVRQIQKIATKFCLSKDTRFVASSPETTGQRVSMPRWTDEDERQLRSLYPDHENLDIARELGRSVASVANKASQLGLKKSRRVLREMGRKNVSIRYEQ